MRCDDEILELVQQKADAIRRRIRRRWVGSSVAAAVVAVASALVAVAPEGGGERRGVVVAAARTTTPTAAGPGGVDDVDRCFPDAPVDAAPREPRKVSGWPPGSPQVAGVGADGTVWVVDGGTATPWTTGVGDEPGAPGYVWARWDRDGTILASRVSGRMSVRVDRLRAPGVAETVAELPFSVSDQAPAGFCPIDGYLATFAVGPERAVLLRHRPGPWQHSCPPARTAEQSELPWRCASPEIVELETAPLKDLATPGQAPFGGVRSGGMMAVIADSSESSALAVRGPSGQVGVYRPGSMPACCLGGQDARVVALSPDGTHWAYSPDGRTVFLGALSAGQATGSPVWASEEEIVALAWSGDWLVAAGRTALTLVSASSGVARRLDGFAPGDVVSLDGR